MKLTFGILVLSALVVAFFVMWNRKQRLSAGRREDQTVTSPLQRVDTAVLWKQQAWVRKLHDTLGRHTQIEPGLYQDLEEVLITADVGMESTTYLLDAVRKAVDRKGRKDPEVLKDHLQEEIFRILSQGTHTASAQNPKPWVIMMVGVNGVGKTTTIAKLAKRFQGEGRKVLLAAGDTFRAAAVAQLQTWGERLGCQVIAQAQGNDPSAVAYDAAQAAKARQCDVLMVDTAGRLHTKANLMEELKKMIRTLGKVIDGAPHEIWLVLDASTGQNALQQAKQFHLETGGISGIVLTKMDGTARGGILIPLARELKVPVRFVGIGEKPDDLRPFDAKEFVGALFS